jgi:isopentenyl-diphosphate delta-isomerase
MNDVILVDKHDNSVGTMDKMKAHEMGVLHRAFSIFLFNDKGELLLQKRQESKYHSAGLWTNTCCSHPKPGETLIDGAKSRLMEEMGISTEIEFAFSFLYKAEFENGLTENEFDHVFIGKPRVNHESIHS